MYIQYPNMPTKNSMTNSKFSEVVCWSSLKTRLTMVLEINTTTITDAVTKAERICPKIKAADINISRKRLAVPEFLRNPRKSRIVNRARPIVVGIRKVPHWIWN